MKKILLISGSLPPIKCGVGYYTHRLVEESAGRMNITLLSTKGVINDSCAPIKTTRDWKIRRIPSIFSTLGKIKPEVVHIQYPSKGYKRELGINFLPYILRILMPKLKIVVTLHEYHDSRIIGRIRNLTTIAPSHKIIVSNNPDFLSLPSFMRRRASIIPIGSNLKKVSPNPRTYHRWIKACNLDMNKITLMFFGFAYPNKGLEVLLDALKLEGAENLQALLLTELDERNSYHKLLIEKVDDLNKTEARVGVTGFLTDKEISEVLQEGLYFVLPQSSFLTAKSSTAISAALHGLILISNGSQNTINCLPFEHLKNSYLLKDMSAEHLIKAIKELEGSPSKDKIRHEAMALDKYFSWQSILDKHKELYDGL